MSLINVFGDGVLDVWAGAFGDVWLGVEVVMAQPDRVYISVGVFRTVHVGLGVTREQQAALGVTRQITIGVER